VLRNFWCIFKREMRAYLTMPAAYVALILFALVNGYFFNMAVARFALASTQMQGPRYASYNINISEWVITPLLMNTGVIMLFFLPIITMRLFAEEKRLRTAELLFSYPLRDFEVLLGKFGAAEVLFTVMLFLVGIDMALLKVYSEPEMAPMLVGFAGLWLMGTAFISLGVFISSLTESQVVAAVGGFGSLLLLYILRWASENAGPRFGRLFEQLSITWHFDNLSKGVVQVVDVVYYILFAVLFFFLTLRSLESKKWRS